MSRDLPPALVGAVVRSHIPRYHQIRVGRKRPFAYDIELAIKDHTWKLEKRYSDFLQLQRQLKDVITPHPQFPSKKLRNKDLKFVESRRKNLETYLSDLLSRPNVLSYPATLEFLQIPDEVLTSPASTRPSVKRTHQQPAALSSNGGFMWVDAQGQSNSTNDPTKILDLNDGSEHEDIVASALSTSIDHGIPDLSGPLATADQYKLFWGSASALDSKSLTSLASSHSVELSREPSDNSPVTCKAISSYTGTTSEDLSFNEGEIVTIIGIDKETGWWMGQRESGERGLVPMNFVKILKMDTFGARCRSVSDVSKKRAPSPLGQSTNPFSPS